MANSLASCCSECRRGGTAEFVDYVGNCWWATVLSTGRTGQAEPFGLVLAPSRLGNGETLEGK
jgi:hypothetical protein